MKTIIRIPDVPVSALDVFRMLPEGTRAEVINNVLYMSPSPIFNHQKLVSTLFLKLGNHIEEKALGELIVSPFDVYLDEYISAVQPDLLFIARRNKGILKEDGYAHGAPDLIIEILSNNETRDRTLKKSLYEKAGVKEYFIVAPETKEVISYYHTGKKYEKGAAQKGKIVSRMLKRTFKF